MDIHQVEHGRIDVTGPTFTSKNYFTFYRIKWMHPRGRSSAVDIVLLYVWYPGQLKHKVYWKSVVESTCR